MRSEERALKIVRRKRVSCMKKEPIFIQERKANFWRGFRSCLALVLMLHSIALVIVYTQPKADQCRYSKGETVNPDCAPGEPTCCVR